MVITDITTSEGNLKRFSRICMFFYPHALSIQNAVEIVKKQIGLQNMAVISRHFRIMKRLKILKRVTDGYSLSSEGRALYEFTKVDGKQILNQYEKIFYFDSLFGNSSHALQFHNLIDAIADHPEDKNEMIKSYFERILEIPIKLWPKDKIKLDLDAFTRNNRFPRSLINRFECMEAWLKQLEILEGKGNDLRLSEIGNALRLKKDKLETSRDVFSFASIFVGKEPFSLPYMTYDLHKEVLIDLIRFASKQFEIPQLKIVDVQAVKQLVCVISLVDNNLVVGKRMFEHFIHNLYRDSVLRSVVTGRDGKMAYIKI